MKRGTPWSFYELKVAKDAYVKVLSIFENGIFKNLVLIDTISDTIVNVALLIGIWFRIKTLKH